MIRVEDLHVSVGNFALRGVSLALREGGCLAILGPSGAGKTLLLETVMGARRPDRGRVLIDGRNITHLPPESRRIAYIPQDLALFPHLSVRRNITFGLVASGSRHGTGDTLDRVVALLDIAHLLDRCDIATLSGGEKQRVALARALIVRPRVLFLDEPLAALDAATRADLWWALRSIRQTLDATIFLVTHDLDEAAFLADDLAIMMGGRLVEYGPRDRVLRQPGGAAAARFLNLRNILSLAQLQAVGLLGADVSSHGGTHVAVRPENIRVMPMDHASAGAAPAQLEALVPLGARAVVRLRVQEVLRLEALLDLDQAAALGNPCPQQVRVAIVPGGVIRLSGDQVAAPTGTGSA